jgi:hypothetical protein
MSQASIRADPATRLPPRPPRNFAILRDARHAWLQTAGAVRRAPLLVLACLFGWGAVRFACFHIIEQAHLNLPGDPGLGRTRWAIAGLFAAAALADAGPVFVAAILMPKLHRLILDQPPPPRAAAAVRAVKLFGVMFVMMLAALTMLNVYRLLPLVLVRALGRTSTILTMILLLPAVCLGLTGLLRLSFGLPALSLGLPRALAEGWAISRGRVIRVLAVWTVALAPVIAVIGVSLWLRPDPSGWPALIFRPCIDMALVALTASLTGVFYRAHRLPPPIRPDMRPSRNPAHRKSPVFF